MLHIRGFRLWNPLKLDQPSHEESEAAFEASGSERLMEQKLSMSCKACRG